MLDVIKIYNVNVFPVIQCKFVPLKDLKQLLSSVWQYSGPSSRCDHRGPNFTGRDYGEVAIGLVGFVQLNLSVQGV